MSSCCFNWYMTREFPKEYVSGAVNNNVVYIEQKDFKGSDRPNWWKRLLRFCRNL